jgi:undecaprenyl-diphosphatase
MVVFCAPLLHLPAASVYLGGYDYTITHFIRGLDDNPVLNTLFSWITFAADSLFMIFTIAALYLGGYRKEAVVTAVALLGANVVTSGLKYLVARPRPSDLGVIPESEPAFPSCHTSNAFSLATILSYYHRNVAPFLYAWAFLVAFSRVSVGLHYFTDLLGGAAVGIVVSLIIVRAAKRYDAQISQFVERLPRYRRSTA